MVASPHPGLTSLRQSYGDPPERTAKAEALGRLPQFRCVRNRVAARFCDLARRAGAQWTHQSHRGPCTWTESGGRTFIVSLGGSIGGIFVARLRLIVPSAFGSMRTFSTRRYLTTAPALGKQRPGDQGVSPWRVLSEVGGTTAAFYAGHPVSYDADPALADLRDRYDEVLAQLESIAGWRTARVPAARGRERPVQPQP